MKLLPLILVLCLTGCGTLIPKKVEFFQDKVKAVPEATAKEKEIQRQAAAKAAEKAQDTLVTAIKENCSTNVVVPAQETAVLTDAVSDSLGPPAKPSTDSSAALAAKLEATLAKLSARLEDFKKQNDENAGKKIEGTGLFQIPYFVWLAICGVIFFVGLIFLSVLWTAVKMYSISNPPVAVGVSAIQAGSKFFKKGFSQVLAGGEKFKEAIEKELPEVKEKVLGIFRREHMQAQDKDVQDVVKGL